MMARMHRFTLAFDDVELDSDVNRKGPMRTYFLEGRREALPGAPHAPLASMVTS